MTNGKFHHLKFYKLLTPSGRLRYTCTQLQRTDDSIYLSNLLDLLSNRLSGYLLHEIDNAINGSEFDEYFSFDVSSLDDSVKMVPPNAIINQEYSIALIELKGLLQEWIAFCNS